MSKSRSRKDRLRAASPSPKRVARGLGWFSVGLGLAQIVAPGALARLIGVDDGKQTRRVMRAVGLREIASGVALIAQPKAARWLWARVGGDVMDLALLGAARRSSSNEDRRIGGAMGAVAGITLVDAANAQRLHQQADTTRRTVKAITIARPADELYAFWRDFENLPQIMAHLESVEVITDGRSRWTAKGPAGVKVSWEAEVVEDRPGELIRWRSLKGSDVDTFGAVSFEEAPGGRGTELRVDLHYDAPGGALGANLAKLFRREPGQEVSADLRRFKQVMETGQVVHSDATLTRGPHPARPSSQAPSFDDEGIPPASLEGETFGTLPGRNEEMR